MKIKKIILVSLFYTLSLCVMTVINSFYELSDSWNWFGGWASCALCCIILNINLSVNKKLKEIQK